MRARWAWAFAALAGCNFDSSAPAVIDNSCVSDADCGQAICNEGICVDNSGAAVSVAIEAIRGESETAPPTPASWVFPLATFSGPSDRDLSLPAVREVRGSVQWEGTRVPSRIRFVRRTVGAASLLPPLPIETETFREPVEDGLTTYDFSVALVAGETYDVSVVPSTDTVTTPQDGSEPAIRTLPPLYLELPVTSGDESEPLRFDVTFPALAKPCETAGDVDVGCELKAQVQSSGEGVEGLQVRAVDRESLRVVSSIAETDQDGRFAIRIINETASDYLIRVSSVVGEDPFPSVSVAPEVAFEGTIDIPRLAPIQYAGQVRDGMETPVPGATVRFVSTGIPDPESSNQPDRELSFNATTTTDEDGRFDVDLLPGVYSVTVTPPEDVDNDWGVLSADVLASEDLASPEVLVVPPQVGLSGEVSTFREEAATGATLLAQARAHSAPTGGPRSQEAVSKELGAFAMSMDAGLYDMHVKVPSESGFGWLVERELEMKSELGDLARSYQLAPPLPIRGVVLSDGGVPLAGAVLRAYVVAGSGSSARTIEVAETTSDEEGRYRLLVTPYFFDE